jgi:VWFA-related protein
MTRRVAIVAGTALLLGLALSARPDARAIQNDVFISAVVVDEHGMTVDGLTQNQFQVKDDGRRVAIDSFREVKALGVGGRGDARSLVLVLDTTGVSPELSARVQKIARQFVDRMGASDNLSVVRFGSRTEEPVAGRDRALERIADYTAGSVPFFGRETFQNSLTMVSKLSQQFEQDEQLEHRRTTIVCLGSPGIFDVKEPRQLKASLLWPYWTRALTAAARADASVYVIDPHGLTGRLWLTANGLAERTGGTVFANNSDFDRAVEQVWREAGHYYVIGYRAPTNFRLHDVKIDVAPHGLSVHARRSR